MQLGDPRACALRQNVPLLLKKRDLVLGQQGLLLHDLHGVDVTRRSLSYHLHLGKVAAPHEAADLKVLGRGLQLPQLCDGIGICKREGGEGKGQLRGEEERFPSGVFRRGSEAERVLMSSLTVEKHLATVSSIMHD